MTNNTLPSSGNITRLTVLALLSFGPMHGYQLQQEIVLRRMERWANIKSGSIYQALRNLKIEGLIKEKGESREGNRPVRLTYQITKEGRATLLELLRIAWTIPQSSADPIEVALSFVMLMNQKEVTDLLEIRLLNIANLKKELLEAKQYITQKPDEVRAMVTDLFGHRLTLLETERAWTKKILGRATSGAYTFN